MRADWKGSARRFIADAVKDLPPEATLTERRAALRLVAGLFHLGTSWGKKVWARECRRYLEQHGLPPLAPRPLSPKHMALLEGTRSQHVKLARPDITFPFREERT